MRRLLRLLFDLFIRSVYSRSDLLLENLALRQQLAVLERRCSRPRFSAPDRLFWVILRRLWPDWRRVLILVQPETVIRWHRAGFKLYWKWLSRNRRGVGRRSVSRELRELIFRMIVENSTWGAPRIHRELKMLGYDISERSGSSRQGCGSCKVEVLAPSITCIRTASISGACRGNEARSARM
jgi:hypothetical protein